ncbi:MAG: hypothetical protein COW00_04880 [Bdellovibrio sp. CG12_big_fil_rev_8_21_14_0_65_39_13]|nr:MAG: hypothetical protein COW78_13080 [Bdellovibrio sp. CG22_combo_CG10-13_8_21_14_all_39_27]PIQ61143.1 MAG: hypothetical protein COW00_04880 [Bdellovibrio sp. CG12_big_fil_rev_8_21_14_0_65_39_13]PIR34815.1 MAG: hypothetical protein COV37_11150 [Bdellovibrio sp. CG11_big_fil_rev_8_21_14_0_20_39_38]PJB52499.1 MAG: hypothetical protein CO099_12305 [Bdellovibrio sp. CG_4_9_14_3_um_filter_39_7]
MTSEHKRKKARQRQEAKAQKKHMAQMRKNDGLPPEEKKFGQIQLAIVILIAIAGSAAILYALS